MLREPYGRFIVTAQPIEGNIGYSAWGYSTSATCAGIRSKARRPTRSARQAGPDFVSVGQMKQVERGDRGSSRRRCVLCKPWPVSSVGALEPPYERLYIAEYGTVLGEKNGQCFGQHWHMVPSGAREPPGVGEDHSRMAESRGRDAPVEHREILDVLGDDRPPISRRAPKQVLIGQPDEVGALLDGDGIVPAMAHAGRDGGGMHLVQEELHPESSLRSFSQAASSRSAMSSLSAISASISSVNSA